MVSRRQVQAEQADRGGDKGGVNVRYLGGKMRQAKQIISAIEPEFKVYVEPFCGAMWSATAVIKAFPGRRYVLNDINPYLMTFWKATYEGWDPPAKVAESTYNRYRKDRPIDDPMTGYVGFAMSFGGKFFGGWARDTKGIRNFSREASKSTLAKIDVLRSADVQFSCDSYEKVKIPNKAMVYLDPPYEGRTRQSHFHDFDQDDYINWAERQAKHSTVIATSFIQPKGWVLLHNYGDTVVRHHSAATKGDGTVELLMRVP